MKKLSGLMLAVVLAFAAQGAALAEHEHSAGEVTVYQCPMDKYTVTGKCPLCGMKLEETHMSTVEAQAAIEKSKQS